MNSYPTFRSRSLNATTESCRATCLAIKSRTRMWRCMFVICLSSCMLLTMFWIFSLSVRMRAGLNIPASDVCIGCDSGRGWVVTTVKKRYTESYVLISGLQSAFRGGRTEWLGAGEPPYWQYRYNSGYTIVGAMFPYWLPVAVFASGALLCRRRREKPETPPQPHA